MGGPFPVHRSVRDQCAKSSRHPSRCPPLSALSCPDIFLTRKWHTELRIIPHRMHQGIISTMMPCAGLSRKYPKRKAAVTPPVANFSLCLSCLCCRQYTMSPAMYIPLAETKVLGPTSERRDAPKRADSNDCEGY